MNVESKASKMFIAHDIVLWDIRSILWLTWVCIKLHGHLFHDDVHKSKC
jgi:hypothetical protein